MKNQRSLNWHSISKVSHTSFVCSVLDFGEDGVEEGVKWSSILSKHGHGDSHWDNKPPREPGCPANILPAFPLSARPPSPLSPGLWSCIAGIMKPYKPVICCFMACFMKVSWQAAPRMVPVTLTDSITKRKGALGREGRAGWRMGRGLYVSPARALMGRGLAAGYHWYILRLPPFVRGTLLTFDLCSYSHLLFTNQLPHRSINQTGWWPVKGPVGMCEELWDRPQAIVEEGLHLWSVLFSIWLTTTSSARPYFRGICRFFIHERMHFSPYATPEICVFVCKIMHWCKMKLIS